MTNLLTRQWTQDGEGVIAFKLLVFYIYRGSGDEYIRFGSSILCFLMRDGDVTTAELVIERHVSSQVVPVEQFCTFAIHGAAV